MDNQQTSRGRRFITSTSIGVLSLLYAFGGTAFTAWLADRFHWCCVHGWALAHGSGIIVMMAWGLIGFHFVSTIAVKMEFIPSTGRFGVLPHAVYISAALGAYWTTDYFMWVGLIFGIVAIIMRLRGNAVKPFGLVLVGLFVSTGGVIQWLYMQWVFSAISS